jgi:hypothetical protein
MGWKGGIMPPCMCGGGGIIMCGGAIMCGGMPGPPAVLVFVFVMWPSSQLYGMYYHTN